MYTLNTNIYIITNIRWLLNYSILYLIICYFELIYIQSVKEIDRETLLPLCPIIIILYYFYTITKKNPFK